MSDGFGVGFAAGFLGEAPVELPVLGDRAESTAWEGGRPLHYEHFSLALNASRRLAIYTAHNLDGARLVRMGRKQGWWDFDPRIPARLQVGAEFYSRSEWDRGHLVRRRDVVWGELPEARRANRHTFYFTNSAPQHHNFNTDEWLCLEDWVLDRAQVARYRLSVFTGPVLRDTDREVRGVRVPSAYWKVVVRAFPDANRGGLSSTAFVMKQDEMWNDTDGAQFLDLTTHQVPLALVEELTDLKFGAVTRADDLQGWRPPTTRTPDGQDVPEWPRIREAEDIYVRAAPPEVRP